jgi:hypothetical protein
MSLPLVIGIAGAKRSGKSTVARFFQSHHFYQPKSFADPLKAMALAIDPIVHVDRDGVLRLSEVVEVEGWESAKESTPEVRRFLQRLGTEGVRGTFGGTAWVDLLFPVDRRTVIADVRFPEEVQAVMANRGVVIRVVRPGAEGDGHASERALDDYDLPVVVNDGAIEELWRKAERAVHHETMPSISIGCAICGSYAHTEHQ